MGDSDCKRYTVASEASVTCYDGKGRETGIRSAMTEEDMRIFIAVSQYQAQQSQAMTDMIRQNNKAMARTTSQALQNASSYSPPAVPPYSPQSVPTSCIRFGTGFSCTSLLDDNNFVCVKAGPTYSCKSK